MKISAIDIVKMFGKTRGVSLTSGMRRAGLGSEEMGTISGGNKHGAYDNVIRLILVFDTKEAKKLYESKIKNAHEMHLRFIPKWKRKIKELTKLEEFFGQKENL